MRNLNIFLIVMLGSYLMGFVAGGSFHPADWSTTIRVVVCLFFLFGMLLSLNGLIDIKGGGDETN